MTKLETIPADEGEALLRQKPTGSRRIVAAAAAVAFLIGVSAAAALRTPAVVNWPSLWGPGTEKMGADSLLSTTRRRKTSAASLGTSPR